MRSSKERADAAAVLYKRGLAGKHGQGTVSGPGSTKSGARMACRAVTRAGAELRPENIVDVPCGDCAWIFDGIPAGVPLRYYGVDILPEVVMRGQATFNAMKDYGRQTVDASFGVADLVEPNEMLHEVLTSADLVVVRDLLQHLLLDEAEEALANVCERQPHAVLLTTWPGASNTVDRRGNWGFAPMDLDREPFATVFKIGGYTKRWVMPETGNKHIALYTK